MPIAEAATALFLTIAEPEAASGRSSRTPQRTALLSLPIPLGGDTFIPAVGMATSLTSEEASTPTRSMTEAYQATVSGEGVRTEADTIVAQLIRMEQWDANWDGGGAEKPLQSSLRSAREFVRALTPDSVLPQPALHADGHAILFLRGSNIYAELEFLEGERIGFYARNGGGQEWTGEFDFDGCTLPEGLSHIGFAVYEPTTAAAA